MPKFGMGDYGDAAIDASSCCQGEAGDPINTRTGSFSYSVGDLSVPTMAGNLVFQRIYASVVTDTFTNTLGAGWTHNLDSRLSFEGDQVWLKAHSANEFRFDIVVSPGPITTYVPYPGVLATLTHIAPTYVLTASNQGVYTFTQAGLLSARHDAEGHVLNYGYDGSDRLVAVTEPVSGRYIAIDYDGNGRIETVSDHTGRQVSYGYDLATGDLLTVTDVLDQEWTYVYSGTTHLLWKVIDPDGAVVLRTEYDSNGQAIAQFDALGQSMVEIAYGIDGSTVITDARGVASTHFYDDRHTLVGEEGALSSSVDKSYDGNFRPNSIENALGQSTELDWSATGVNLEEVTDALNQTTSFDYDALNNLTRTVDARSVESTFSYSGTLLTAVSQAGTSTSLYTYTAAADAPQPVNMLKESTDPQGRTTSYQYDSIGQLVRITDTSGLATAYGYDDLGRVITTTSLASTAAEQITVNSYDAAGRLLQVIRNYTDASGAQNYAANGSVYNQITRYQYDPVGNQVAMTDTLGLVTLTQYDANNRPVAITVTTSIGQVQDLTRMLYDAAGNTISTTVRAHAPSLAQTTVTGYDALNRPVTVTTNYVDGSFDPDFPDEDIFSMTTYDAAGNVLAVTEFPGTALERTSATSYDALNRPISVTANSAASAGPNPNITSLTRYDPNGNVISTTAYAGIAGLEITTLTEYDPLNRPVTTTTAAGTSLAITSVTAYNAAGQVISVTEAFGTDQARTSLTEYDSAGRPVTVTANYDGTGIAAPDRNLVQVTVYDELGRRAASGERRVDSAGSATWITTTFGYNNLGQLLTTTWPLTSGVFATASQAYDALGRVVTQTDELGRLTVTQYDALGRPVTVTAHYVDGVFSAGEPDEDLISVTTYDAAGNRVLVTDPKGIQTRFGYDLLGRLVQVVENYGEFEGQAPVTTTYGYDAAGNLLTITDGRGKVSTFTYDLLGRQVSATDPLTHTTVYTYNAAGSQTALLDANGQETAYVYDLLGRMTDIDYPAGTADVSFQYDLLGQRTVMTDGTGTTTWAYDLANRPITITQAGIGAPVIYTYNSAGQRTALLYPGSQTANYQYDLAGRLVGVTDWASQFTGYTYDTSGQLLTTALHNSITSTYGYDSAYRLLSIAHVGVTHTVGAYTYTVDAAGQRISVEETSPVEEAGPPPTNPITVTVTTDELNSDGDCSLREAVRAALLDTTVDNCPAGSSVNPDLILLPAGTFTLSVSGRNEDAALTGDLDLSGQVILAGAGLTQTTINANSVDRVLHILSGAKVTLQDLTLKGGEPGTNYLGGGLYVSGAVTLTNASVTNNHATQGGGIYVTGGQATLITGTIKSNTADAGGGGVFVAGAGGSFTMLDGIVKGNWDTYAAGVKIQQGTALLAGGQITGNFGVGLVAGTTSNYPVTVVISGVEIVGHTGAAGGMGVDVLGNQTVVTITAGSIRSNVSTGNWAGGGLEISNGGRVYMSGGEIYTNTARTGGGVQINNGTFEFAGGEIKNNRATYQGGGVFIYSTSARFIQSGGDVRYNVANNDGGGVYANGHYLLSDGRVGNNLANYGNSGGIEVNWYGVFTQTGGSVMENTVWGGGGGIWIYYGKATLLGGRVYDNNAYYGGGVSMAQGTLIISGTAIYNNYGIVDAAGVAVGGGTATINNTTISVNRANGHGGGVRVSGGTATLTFVSVISNTADYDSTGGGDGGGLSRSGGTLNFGSTLVGNNVDKGGQAPDCAGSVTSQDYNLIESTTGCTVGGTTTHNVTGQDPLVDPLTEVSGTWVHPLQDSSPALEAGASSNCPAVDQRGESRPADADCDIGAYEWHDMGGFARPGYYSMLNAGATGLAARPLASAVLTGTVISYTYDAFYRLTRADYDDGSYFAYAYDEVGNRTSEVACWGGGSCTPITTTYAYDDANRLIEVDGQPYTWDANGNLISFGSTTYSYDAANRLTDYVVQLGPSAYYGESYTYNGLGDRVQRTVYPSIGGTIVTTYTLDLAAGLTQVLADGTYTYLYGQGRIAQDDGADFDYFLGDALGSVRQLADEAGEVTLARRYEPYGDVLESAGTGTTSYDFTGDLRDSTGLVFLRARYYASATGRFVTRDAFPGFIQQPTSLHTFIYGHNDPVNRLDPSGYVAWDVRRGNNRLHELIEEAYEKNHGAAKIHREYGPGLQFGSRNAKYNVDIIYFGQATGTSFAFGHLTAGEVYEIEPIIDAYKAGEGTEQAQRYVDLLTDDGFNFELQGSVIDQNGTYAGMAYDWNDVKWLLGDSLPSTVYSVDLNPNPRRLVFWKQAPGLIVYVDTDNGEHIRTLINDERYQYKRYEVVAVYPQAFTSYAGVLRAEATQCYANLDPKFWDPNYQGPRAWWWQLWDAVDTVGRSCPYPTCQEKWHPFP